MKSPLFFLILISAISPAFGDCFNDIEASQAEHAVRLKALHAQNPMITKPSTTDGVISGFTTKDAYKKEVKALVQANEKEYNTSMDACRTSKGLKDY